MRKSWLLGWLIVGVLACWFVAAPPVPRLRGNDLRPVVLRPSMINTVTKSVKPMLIDLYWLRTLNAIGEAESPEKNASLYEYGRVLTDSDPRFYTAYTYIGLNVPFRTGRNTFVNGDLAVDLFQRGLKQFPDDMKLHLYLGYALYGQAKRYKEASAVFLAGSKKPGAPSFMAPLAARLLAHSGDAEEAVSITQQLLDGTTDEETRKEFEGKLLQLKIEVQLQKVDRAIDAFTKAEGRKPANVYELIEKRYYTDTLEDLAGGLISIGADGRATSTSVERRYEVYE
jgi:tetratricopeptide (TPR) repeat protein